jgi:nicotinic acid mononucleotide adenylyltransferase
MKNYKQLIKELPSKSVVFAFGRFNPPTIGHELLFKVVKKLASSHNAEYVIYASRTQDKKKNPLSVDRKIHYLKLMFPGTNFVAANEEIRTFMEAAKLLNKKYKNLIMVAGSDRVQEYTKLLNNYNGKEYHFDTIQVISAGERDPDSDEASGMSASKMRAAAAKGDYAIFKRGLPSSVRELDGKLLMNELRHGMGLESIKEQINLVKDDLREQYFRGEIFNVGDIVESDDELYEIVKRGSNHLLLKEQSGNLISKWIQDVTMTEDKKGLWDNIHAKQKRIKNGSGEHMRKPGSKGAPSDQDLKNSQVKEDHMSEDLTDKTIKPNDKLKVARIIAAFLGVESPESLSNPEQIVNMGLRKAHSKSLHTDSIAMLRKMMSLADEVGINYDSKLLPKTVKESIDSRVTVDTKSNYNAAKDILRYKDFKKLMKMNKGEVDEAAAKAPNKGEKDITDNPSNDDTDRQKTAGEPDKLTPDVNAPALTIATHDLENQGPRDSEVGSQYGHGNDSQLRRRKVNYQREEVELDEDVMSADFKVDPVTGRKSRAHRIDFKNSKAKGKLDHKEKDDGVDGVDEAKEKIIKKVPSPIIKKDVLGGGAKSQAFDAFFGEETEEQEVDDISEKDLDQMADTVDTIEDIIDAYDDHELAIIDDENGEEIEKDLKEEVLNEVLSRMERIRAKVKFARTKSQRERKTRIALKKHSDNTTLNTRARRLAIKLLKTRIGKKDPSKMSIGEKERVEKALSTKKVLINRLAMKLVSRVRKIENDRLSHHKYTKK